VREECYSGINHYSGKKALKRYSCIERCSGNKSYRDLKWLMFQVFL